MTTRLDTLSPVLAALVRDAAEGPKRLVMREACDRAVLAARLNHPDVGVALDVLHGRTTPNDLSRADLLRRLAALVQHLDQRYLALQQRAEEGLAEPHAYVVPFTQARAASALAFALRGNAADAVYEACAAKIDHGSIITALTSALRA